MLVLKQLVDGIMDSFEMSWSKSILVSLNWFGSINERDVVFDIPGGGFARR
jgi:hypothetical protein